MAPEFINHHPELPWRKMRGMRNIVVHQYFDVDLKVLWTTVKDDSPSQKEQIDRLLNQPPR
jgi:uncharacterized protein with HEPN domain